MLRTVGKLSAEAVILSTAYAHARAMDHAVGDAGARSQKKKKRVWEGSMPGSIYDLVGWPEEAHVDCPLCVDVCVDVCV